MQPADRVGHPDAGSVPPEYPGHFRHCLGGHQFGAIVRLFLPTGVAHVRPADGLPGDAADWGGAAGQCALPTLVNSLKY